jgi:hypothetical protein
MNDLRALTETRLRESIAELLAVRRQLSELHASLPVSPQEDAMLL